MEEGSTLSIIPATLVSTVTSDLLPGNASAAAWPMSVCTQLSRTCQPLSIAAHKYRNKQLGEEQQTLG